MHRKTTAQLLAGFVFLVGGLTVAPTAAWAQGQPGTQKEADRLGKEGEKLLEKHDAQAAIEPLSKAYGLSNNPRFLLPLGLAYAEAERPLDALDALGRFLKDAPAVPDTKRKEIGARFAVMLDQVAALVTLDASRQNAPVKIDGRPVGTTPIQTPLRLMPGKHEIVMQPAPTDPSSGAKVVIEVKPGERRTIKLEPGAPSRFLEPQAQNDGTATPPTATTAGSHSETPIYKKGWFWTVVGGGAAAVLAIGLGAGLANRGSPGSTDFPSVSNWPGGPIDGRTSALIAVTRFSL